LELAVIIPTYNEAQNVQVLIPEIHAALKSSYTIVVVDDNSPDNTRAVVERLSAAYPVKLVSRPRKLGLASAVIDGMKSHPADAYVVMDADFSHPPEMLPTMRSEIEVHDLVVASRHVKGGSAAGWPAKRRFISRVAILFARPLTPVKDATSGFFAIRRECLQNASITPLGFKIGLECFVKADWRSFSEVPFVFTDRRHGDSKMSIREVGAYIRQLYHLYAYALYRLARSLISIVSRRKRFNDPNYDWTSWYRGNFPQRWWKRTLAYKALKLASQSQAAMVLNIGCGSSPMTTLLGNTSVGIDINLSKLSFMHRRSPASFLNMDAYTLAFKDRSFDQVFCIELVEHLSDPTLAIGEISRILTPRGTAVIATPDYGTLRWRIIEKVYSIAMPYAYASDHITKLTRQSLVRLCEQHELTHIGTEYVLGADMVLLFQKNSHHDASAG
jgi:glycosyltransferase involved in cell wall biosynthesis